MSSQIKAGQAYVEISTKKGLFDKGLAAVQKSMKAFASSASFVGRGVAVGVGGAQKALGAFSAKVFSVKNALIGSFAVAGVGKLVSDFADAGSAIDDMAQRTGMSAESISALSYAAKLSGSSIDDVEKASRNLTKTIAKAADGNKSAKEQLTALGLSAEQLQTMSPEQQFLAIAEQVSKIPDQTMRAASAMTVFGKSGSALLPMMMEGAGGIQTLMDEAAHMGQVMSGEDASAAANLGDAMDVLWGSIDKLKNLIGASLAPLLATLVDRMTSNITAVMEWGNMNRSMIVVIAQMAAGIGVAGAALLAIAGTAALVSAALGGLVAVAGVVSGAFTAMGAVIAAVMSPIGIVLAGVAVLGAAIIYYSGAGGAMVDYLGARFQDLLTFVMPVIDAIREALISGQFAAAGKVLFTALEIAFRTGTQTLYGVWIDLGVRMQNTWTDVWGVITDNFGGIVNGIASMWETTVNQIAKSLLYLYSLFDRSVDYEQAAKALDKEAKAKKREREQAGFASKEDRERLKQERIDKAQENKDIFANRISELKDQLTETIAEVYAVSEQNANDAETNLESRLPKLGDLAIPSLQKVNDKVDAKATAVTGTFSGFAAGMLGGSVSTFDRMLDEAKQTNELLEVLTVNTENLGGDLRFEE